MYKHKKISPLGENWSDFEKTIFTPEEITASDLKISSINRTISSVGDDWDNIRKFLLTPNEIAETNLKVISLRKAIKTHHKNSTHTMR